MKTRRPSQKAFCISCGWKGKVWNWRQRCPKESTDPTREMVVDGRHVKVFHLLIHEITPWPKELAK